MFEASDAGDPLRSGQVLSASLNFSFDEVPLGYVLNGTKDADRPSHIIESNVGFAVKDPFYAITAYDPKVDRFAEFGEFHVIIGMDERERDFHITARFLRGQTVQSIELVGPFRHVRDEIVIEAADRRDPLCTRQTFPTATKLEFCLLLLCDVLQRAEQANGLSCIIEEYFADAMDHPDLPIGAHNSVVDSCGGVSLF